MDKKQEKTFPGESEADPKEKYELILNKSSLPYGSSTLDPPIRLIDRAYEIEKANEKIASHANSKLSLIVEQIQNLQKKAEEIITAAQKDAEYHKIECAFEKKPGQWYHIYRRENGKKFISRLSPLEWSSSACVYLESICLKYDGSFDYNQIETED